MSLAPLPAFHRQPCTALMPPCTATLIPTSDRHRPALHRRPPAGLPRRPDQHRQVGGRPSFTYNQIFTDRPGYNKTIMQQSARILKLQAAPSDRPGMIFINSGNPTNEIQPHLLFFPAKRLTFFSTIRPRDRHCPGTRAYPGTRAAAPTMNVP